MSYISRIFIWRGTLFTVTAVKGQKNRLSSSLVEHCLRVKEEDANLEKGEANLETSRAYLGVDQTKKCVFANDCIGCGVNMPNSSVIK